MLDIDNYIEANQLKPINKPLDVIAEKFLKFDEFSMVNTSFYYKENKIEGESSYVLFNADEGKLWVTVAYKNLE